MPKRKTKPTTPHIKDPKKQAAGRARAAKALRVEGRFISTKFEEGLKKDMQLQGIPLSKAQQYLEQNEQEYKSLYLNEQQPIENNYEQLMYELNKTENTIFFNGRKVKKATALKYIAELKRYLGTEFDFWNFRTMYTTTMAGKLSIKLPRPSELEKLELNDEKIVEYLEDEYEIEVEDGTDPKTKRERIKAQRKAKKEKRCKFILNNHGKRCKNIAQDNSNFCYIHNKFKYAGKDKVYKTSS